MNVPDYSTLAEAVFNSYPEDVKTLNQLCDQCEADRAKFGEDDPRVQAGEVRVNNLKGLFTRRIAWACYKKYPWFGLRKKTSGAIATRPADGLRHSTDVLMMLDDGQIIDVMSDRHSTWMVTPGDTQPLDQWVTPLPPDGEPVPAPTPVPVPASPPAPGWNGEEDLTLDVLLAPVLARLQAIEAQQKADGAAAVDALGQLQARIVAVEKTAYKLEHAPELPKLVAVGKVHIFGYDYNVRFPVQKA